MRVLKVKVISLPYILHVLCFTRPRYQVSVYRTIGPLVSNSGGHHNYAPNFEEVWEAYSFGPVRPSVCPSVSVTLALGQEPLEIGS